MLLRRGLVTFLASPVTLGVGIVGGSGLGVFLPRRFVIIIFARYVIVDTLSARLCVGYIARVIAGHLGVGSSRGLSAVVCIYIDLA